LTAISIKRSFLLELDKSFADIDFGRVSDRFYGERYDRWLAAVRHSASFGLVVRRDYLEVGVPFISVRFDVVEQLVAKFQEPHPLLKASDIEARSTVEESLSDLFGDETPRLNSEEQAIALVPKIFPIVHREGIAFWTRFSDPHEALRLLRGDDERARAAAGPDDIVAQKAVALSFVFVGKEEAERVAREKLAQLKDPATYRNTFRWVEKLLAEG